MQIAYFLRPNILSSVASHTIPQAARFSKKKKKLQNTKYVFWFSLWLLSETFLILSRIQRQIYMYIGLHVKYPLFLLDFNETWIFSTDFRKTVKYHISRTSVPWEPSSTRTERQTSYSRFAHLSNEPKTPSKCTVTVGRVFCYDLTEHQTNPDSRDTRLSGVEWLELIEFCWVGWDTKHLDKDRQTLRTHNTCTCVTVLRTQKSNSGRSYQTAGKDFLSTNTWRDKDKE